MQDCQVPVEVIPIQFRDSFQSPFKDNCRFFAGLYSIFRTIALVTSTMIQDPQSFYAMVELELVLIILLQATIQPYKEKKYNLKDLLLFSNLAIINGITQYNYFIIVREEKPPVHIPVTITLQIILMSLPLLCMLVMCTFKLVKKVKTFQRASGTVTYTEIAPTAS